jgi:hypothetical protein
MPWRRENRARCKRPADIVVTRVRHGGQPCNAHPERLLRAAAPSTAETSSSPRPVAARDPPSITGISIDGMEGSCRKRVKIPGRRDDQPQDVQVRAHRMQICPGRTGLDASRHKPIRAEHSMSLVASDQLNSRRGDVVIARKATMPRLSAALPKRQVLPARWSPRRRSRQWCRAPPACSLNPPGPPDPGIGSRPRKGA